MFKTPFGPKAAFCVTTKLYPIPLAEKRRANQMASAKSAKEFKLGRGAAHRALAKFTAEIAPIPSGAAGEPIWPAGIVGSISHKAGLAAAVVGRAKDFDLLGIDLELNTSKNISRLASRIGVKSEVAWMLSLPKSATKRVLMVFSAKEAIYKAFYQALRVKLRYPDVCLSWNSNRRAFRCRLNKKLSSQYMKGFNFWVGVREHKSYILSFICLRS